MAQDPDPVGNGFVVSLARPGGNVTGLSNLSPELIGKQLELLKEIVPRLARVAVLGHSGEPGNGRALQETGRAAGQLGVQIQYLDVRSPADVESAFRAARSGRADAVLVLNSPLAASHRARIAELAVTSRLPVMHQVPQFVDDGGLVTYGVNGVDLWRRAAVYVDKILRGARPADLPVEQPTRFDLIFNLKAAGQIGLTIPPGLLARADRIIK
jgi:putative ABC transport system substrate-binding protein